jgi:hypothetical protein
MVRRCIHLSKNAQWQSESWIEKPLKNRPIFMKTGETGPEFKNSKSIDLQNSEKQKPKENWENRKPISSL